MEIFDCTKCGACCQHAGEIAVEISTDEIVRDGVDIGVPRHLTRSVRGMMGFAHYESAFIRRMHTDPKTGRCIALAGTIGECVSCKIYEKRPDACRTFEPGSDDCLKSRIIAFGISGSPE